MVDKDNIAWDKLDFTVISISKIPPPHEFNDEPWYKYIIGRGDECFKGMRQGTLQEVTEHADNLVDDLNARRYNKMGSMWRSKTNSTKS